LKSSLKNAIALAITGLAISSTQINIAVAQQRGANIALPPPPAYAQQVNPNYAPNPYRQSGSHNFGDYPPQNRYGNFAPNNFNNFRPNNFGPSNFRSPNFNSNNYSMPWNRNGNNSPMMSSSNLPMMNSCEWARKVPDWGKNNGPYGNGPWANDRVQNKMEDWWDDMINAPHDMGRMPGGWKAPSISMPNPVDVGDQFGNQFDKLPGQVREMDVGN